MLTVKEVLAILNDHHITNSEQVLRRWLRKGRIVGERHNRKTGWQIRPEAVYSFLLERQWEGTPYEVGIDDATRIQRFLRETKELRHRIDELQKENSALRKRLGEEPF